MKNAIVPLADRKPNPVDRLVREIAEIQSRCVHDFRILESLVLRESRVAGVFVVRDSEQGFVKSVTIRCLNCSKEQEEYIQRTCCQCLGILEVGEQKDRQEYFGHSHGWHKALLLKCHDCGAQYVSDELCS